MEPRPQFISDVVWSGLAETGKGFVVSHEDVNECFWCPRKTADTHRLQVYPHRLLTEILSRLAGMGAKP